MIKTAKYRTPEQRESIIWLVSVKDKLAEYADEWSSSKRKLIASEIVPKLEEWAVQLMEDIAPKEGNAIIQMCKRVNPMLIASDFSETNDKITVDADDFYKAMEWGLEYCKFSAMVRQINKMTSAKAIKEYIKDNFKCQECKDTESCEARKVFLHFLVPNLTESGPCQYFRGEE